MPTSVCLSGEGETSARSLSLPSAREVVPEDLEIVPPVAADPVGEVGDVGPGCRQGHRSEGRLLGLDLARGHGQAAEGRRRLDLVDVLAELVVAEPVDLPDAVEADRVDDGAGDRDLGRGGAGVLHPEAQDEGRDAGIVRLQRDERIEGLEPDLERDLAVGELDLGEGVFALEAGFLHARQAGHEDAAEAEAGRERRLDRTLEDADVLLARLLDVEGEEGEGHMDALAGPVEDLPVAEVAAAAERDRARADAAEREGDLVEGRPFERADRSGAKELVLRIRPRIGARGEAGKAHDKEHGQAEPGSLIRAHGPSSQRICLRKAGGSAENLSIGSGLESQSSARSSGDGSPAPLKKLLDLLFHVAVVGALPEDAVAAGADGERRGMLADVGRDEVPGPLPGERLEREIAGDAPRVRPDLVPELEFVEDLDDLVLPVVAADEEAVGPLGRPLDEPRVAGEEDAPLAPGDARRGPGPRPWRSRGRRSRGS